MAVSLARRAADQDRHKVQCHHSRSHAAEQKPGKSAAPVRGHDDHVASVVFRGGNDAFVGKTILHVHGLSPNPRGFRHRHDMVVAVSIALFSYTARANPNAASPVTTAFQGSVTVTTVNFASSTLASSMPCDAALSANSDPSVAISMFLNTVLSNPVSATRDAWDELATDEHWHRAEGHDPVGLAADEQLR